MKKEININKNWNIYTSREKIDIKKIEKLKSLSIDLPFNIETVYEKGDLFKGLNTQKNQRYEDYDCVIEKEFIEPKHENKRVILHMDKVDCFAEYYLNGNMFFKSSNALVGYDIDITKLLKKNNELIIRLNKTKDYIKKKEDYESTRKGAISTIRKPAYSFGWDIFPRAISRGIYGDVKLIVSDNIDISDVNYRVEKIENNKATLVFDVKTNNAKKDDVIVIEGKCGKSIFSKTFELNERLIFEIDNPKLWWPLGYGKANLYKTVIKLVRDDKTIAIRELNVGIRTCKLIRTDTMLEKNHDFRFMINNKFVFLNGSNFVPVTPYYSKEKQRLEKSLKYWVDSKSNILRVWGGGYYEDDYLYDFCDRNGICVWQDFMSACVQIDPNVVGIKNLEYEYSYAINRLKIHPSIILWAGDNEIDESCVWENREGGDNPLTRKLLPKLLKKLDPNRDYLMSSPYIPKGYYDLYAKGEDVFVERHLWGARDYYKASYYKGNKAHFVSECGYQGVPSYTSLMKMFSSDKLWPIFNDEWILHSSDQKGDIYRVNWTYKQVIQLFGREPKNLKEFILMSQISQAEALKFFIERMRIKKPYTTGIIWWNMIDGWPQVSDAVVDYYYSEKLAYSYVKKSQETVCLMFDELKDWKLKLYANNNSFNNVKGTYRVFDIDNNKELLKGKFTLKENENKAIDELELFYSDKKFLVIEYIIGNKKYYNHYLSGFVPFEIERYKKWLKKYENL